MDYLPMVAQAMGEACSWTSRGGTRLHAHQGLSSDRFRIDRKAPLFQDIEDSLVIEMGIEIDLNLFHSARLCNNMIPYR